jgi:transposase
LRRCSTNGKRNRHSKEFKEETVKLITEHGYTISEAARNVGVNANMLGRWKRELERDREDISGVGNMKVLQSDIKRLRKENQRLKMEREILKKAAAFFAKESE